MSVFSRGPAPRRFAAWLAVPAVVTLVAAAVIFGAASVAVARGPGGGYQEPYNGKRAGWLGDVWPVAHAPLRWLRQSSRSFQSLMRLLAERSAGAEPPPLPRRPRKEPVEEVEEDPPPRSSYGGEAGAGRDRGGVRVKEWHKRASSCRRAGVPVRRGGWYVVQRGDTLWHVAELHYGYGEAYPRIRRANSESVPDADLIHPCQRLYIPRWRCCGPRPVTEKAGWPPREEPADDEDGGEDEQR